MPASKPIHAKRFSVSLESDLFAAFEEYRVERGYATRSEAIRDLIRDGLVQRTAADPDAAAVGTLTLVYDHDAADLTHDLNDLQHHHHDNVICTTHVHLNAHECLEVTVLRGRVREVERLANHLLAHKGVKHGKLVVTSASANGPDDGEASRE